MEYNKICSLYLITNILNHKKYIGQTWNSILFRWQQHCSKSEITCVKLNRSIKKYGKDNFKVEILAKCSSQEIADYLEISYIEEYNSIKKGYNIRLGGSRGKHSEATKKKLRKPKKNKENYKGKNTWSKGFKVSDKTKQKIAKSMKGKKNAFGSKHSKETKQKMSLKRRGKTWKLIDGKRVWMNLDNV